MSNLLPIRPSPKPDESLTGYLVRLSGATSHEPRFVSNLIGVQIPCIDPADDHLKALAELTGKDVNRLAAMAYRRSGPSVSRSKYGPRHHQLAFLGHGIVRHHLIDETRQVCIECLKESCHHRILWDLRLLDTCPEHGRSMLSKCPSCGKGLQWNTTSIDHCGACGRRLLVAQEGEPQEVISAARFLRDLVQGVIAKPELLQDLSVLQTLDVLEAMALAAHRAHEADGRPLHPVVERTTGSPAGTGYSLLLLDEHTLLSALRASAAVTGVPVLNEANPVLPLVRMAGRMNGTLFGHMIMSFVRELAAQPSMVSFQY